MEQLFRQYSVGKPLPLQPPADPACMCTVNTEEKTDSLSLRQLSQL